MNDFGKRFDSYYDAIRSQRLYREESDKFLYATVRPLDDEERIECEQEINEILETYPHSIELSKPNPKSQT
ncbi:hypothetical protein [Merismopedia glauca]|uniref:Uncharacterized protein n=1 Tax=Merismopedia glauca CCAP 1448/3 TaxID=1296344 RepID=A0A2T1C9H3_9CYAN|nr:hypothetical protein [Merismopedia glauca]PSB04925.1 hypothetical protein C7B64_01470 [Merismopedia glauca CCAP 1448/3]